MIHKLQSQIPTLTHQVNKLVEQAANESQYRTVEQTNTDATTQSLEEDPSQPNIPVVKLQMASENQHILAMLQDMLGNQSSHVLNTEGLPSPDVQPPDYQTNYYNEIVQRTSTLRTPQGQTHQLQNPRPRPQTPQTIQWPDTSKKKVREKSRECHNHKPQPFPDTMRRRRKQTKPNKHKLNKHTKSTKISSLFPKWGNPNGKRTEKHKNKITQGKT